MMGKGQGGLERAGADCHEALSLAGCEVVSVIHAAAQLTEVYQRAGETIGLRSLGAWDALAAFRLRRKLGNRTFDAVVVHGNRALYLAKRLGQKAPVIAVCHTTNYNILKALDLIDGAIVLTGHYFDVLTGAGFPAEQIRTVPNSIRLGDEPGDPPDRAVPVIGGLGRLVPNKGFDVLLKALALLKARGTAFRCVIQGVDEAGSVAHFENMRDQLGLGAEEAAFPGWTDQPQAFLRSVDIFCLPSRREVQSLALLEALAAGRPIVCTRVPGLEQVFTDGVEGQFVDIEDETGLAGVLGVLLHDRDRRLAMGRAARRRARDFDITAVGAQLRTALEDLAGAGPSEIGASFRHARS